jgi:hypothetical protein
MLQESTSYGGKECSLFGVGNLFPPNYLLGTRTLPKRMYYALMITYTCTKRLHAYYFHWSMPSNELCNSIACIPTVCHQAESRCCVHWIMLTLAMYTTAITKVSTHCSRYWHWACCQIHNSGDTKCTESSPDLIQPESSLSHPVCPQGLGQL